MREAQAFATSTRHLFTMWSAASRAQAYAAVDRAVQERLTPAEWARYQAEPHRPVFQRLVLGAVLAGAELGAVVDKATGGDFTAARSVAAVMHGRLEAAGYRPGQAAPQPVSQAPEHEPANDAQGRMKPLTWAERVPEVIRPQARQTGLELGAALDARGEELAHDQAGARSPGSWKRWALSRPGARQRSRRIGWPASARQRYTGRPPGSPTPARCSGQFPRDTPYWPRPTRARSARWRSATPTSSSGLSPGPSWRPPWPHTNAWRPPLRARSQPS